MSKVIGLDSEIAIVGAGIAGLALAFALARSGATRVQIFERRTELRELGAGLQLGPNATRILIGWGLERALLEASSQFQKGVLRSALSNRRLADISLNDRAMSTYGAPNCQLARDQLHDMLWQALINTLGYDPVILGAEISAVACSAERPSLTKSMGDEHEFDIIFAGDGVHSAIRSSLFPDGPSPTYSGYYAWRGVVNRENLPPDMKINTMCVWLDEEKHLVAYPINDGAHINLVGLSEHPTWHEASGVVSVSSSEWLKECEHWQNEPKQLIAALDSCQKWALATMPPLPSWNSGAVGLLGDAAHPMLPSLAQGAAQAIEDAQCLTALVSTQEYSAETLLNTYFQARIARATRVQQVALWNLEFFHRPRTVATSLRDLAMRAGGPLTTYFIARRYRWLYGKPVLKSPSEN